MAVSYWLGIYTGTRASYETEMVTGLASAAKIPINPPLVKEEQPLSVQDVYAKLDESQPLQVSPNTTQPKGTESPELAAIKKVELPEAKHLANGGEDLDAELSETLLKPSDSMAPSKEKQLAKSAGEDVWSTRSGQQVASPKKVESGGISDTTKTLGSEKPEVLREASVAGADQKKGLEHLAKNLGAIPNAPSTDLNVASVENQKETSAIHEMVKTVPTAASTPKASKEDKQKEKEKLKEAEKASKQETAEVAQKKTSVPRGWFAQVAAPKELKDADAIALKLRKSGFTVVVETAKVRGENYYRILVGPENTKETADRLLGQLKRETYLQGEPFVRMVK
ncbi:MAG: SPOR domain-containing protein [SAR324 cluster bacterium]|uniref:SPOR domain-containing protein n=1 Tax=SAR324 cluster bacterium TaxID=2024889 RepID=A0A7X9FRM8_9DELT|nr:SPOR domain-containing protein [SAR324 cluster bacterium]